MDDKARDQEEINMLLDIVEELDIDSLKEDLANCEVGGTYIKEYVKVPIALITRILGALG